MTGAEAHDLKSLTIQSRPSAIAFIQELCSLHGNLPGVSHFVWVKFVMRTQEAGAVNFFSGSGVIKPLLKPVKGDKLIRLACTQRKQRDTTIRRKIQASIVVTAGSLYLIPDIHVLTLSCYTCKITLSVS